MNRVVFLAMTTSIMTVMTYSTLITRLTPRWQHPPSLVGIVVILVLSLSLLVVIVPCDGNFRIVMAVRSNVTNRTAAENTRARYYGYSVRTMNSDRASS